MPQDVDALTAFAHSIRSLLPPLSPRALSSCAPFSRLTRFARSCKVVLRINTESSNYPSPLNDSINVGFILPWISFVLMHLAGFSFTEICLGLFHRRLLLCAAWPSLAVNRAVAAGGEPLWTWTGSHGIPWEICFVIWPITFLLNAYILLLLLRPPLLTTDITDNTDTDTGTDDSAIESGENSYHLSQTGGVGMRRRMERQATRLLTATAARIIPASPTVDFSWVLFLAGLCALCFSSGILRLVRELVQGLTKLIRPSLLPRIHFPGSCAVLVLLVLAAATCWVLVKYSDTVHVSLAAVVGKGDSAPVAAQGGILLVAAAGTVCYTTLDLGVYPLYLSQVWTSLAPVVVIGIMGALTSAVNRCTPTWSREYRNGRLRAGIALYPAAQTFTTLAVPLIWRPGGARKGHEGHPELLYSEHRHLAENDASYFAARLMMLVPLVAVQLMLRTRRRAILALVAFSMVHIWVVADDHTDVSDDVVAAALVAHLLLISLTPAPRLVEYAHRCFVELRRRRSKSIEIEREILLHATKCV